MFSAFTYTYLDQGRPGDKTPSGLGKMPEAIAE